MNIVEKSTRWKKITDGEIRFAAAKGNVSTKWLLTNANEPRKYGTVDVNRRIYKI